jgi:hypothetical protein
LAVAAKEVCTAASKMMRANATELRDHIGATTKGVSEALLAGVDPWNSDVTFRIPKSRSSLVGCH